MRIRIHISANILAAMLMAVFLWGCKTSKTAMQGSGASSIEALSEQANINYLRNISDNYQYAQNLTAKIKFSAEMDSQDLTLSGNLRMKRDDVIQISLVAFGIIEAARFEFTPEYAMIIDRINKRYVKEKYSNIDFLKANGLDFYCLQALFWNELFCPGTNKIEEGNLGLFSVSQTTSNPTVMLKETAKPQTALMKATTFSWDTNRDNSKVTAAKVSFTDEKSRNSYLDWKYSSFSTLSKRLFPMQHDIEIETPSLHLNAGITLSNTGTNNDWETRTNLSGKYTKVAIEDILKSLGQ